MTLCIAAKFPWGIMATLPGPPVPQAILFATDSRLTEALSNRTLDIGEKLFPICDNAGLVFAGDFHIGRKCVQRLKSKLEGKQPISASEIISIAQSAFKQEFDQFASSERHSSIMLGVYDCEGNQAKLVGYKSPSFEPTEMKGVNAIGSTPKIQELYKQKFDDFVKERFSHGGVGDNPLEWLNFIQIVLNNAVIESGADPHIGGIVQTAILDRNGFQWVGHARRKHDKWISTERKNEKWHVVEVESKREIAQTERAPEGFFKISD